MKIESVNVTGDYSDKMADTTRSPIAEFYVGRSILITGATGFMGKVLVEKLLRSCPGIKNIYLLMRPKRDCDVRTRLDQLLSATLFDILRRERPDALSKLVPVCGDILLPELGISPSDKEILMAEVSIVFHAAATVKFDEPLNISMTLNVIAVKRLLNLCHKIVNLNALIHVSTAYCNCDRSEVNELIYPPPADPEKTIQMIDIVDNKLLDSITPNILGKRPNTYTFTKALVESVLLENRGNIPVAIVRPSIVTATYREPMPGWVDSLNGATGVLVGIGKGILRSIVCSGDLVGDLMPVDIAINMLIAVAWHTASTKPSVITVYNCTSGGLNPIKWKQVVSLSVEFFVKHPFDDIFWYPGYPLTSNRFKHRMSVAAFQMLPAHMSDIIARLIGKRPIMVGVQQNLQRVVESFEFFTTREWRFSNDNVIHLLGQLSPNDRKVFNFDIRELVWRDYFEQYVLGMKTYVMKDDPINTVNAKRSKL